MTKIKDIQLPNGPIRFPAFLPDGTQGVVRGLDASDLAKTGLQALVMNTYHLMQKPGSSTIQALGGLHQMSQWQGPILTDSGGFQAYSLIRENPKLGSLTDKGITIKQTANRRKFQLTPEKAVQLQIAYGADIVVCLDDCTHVDDSYEIQSKAVERTLSWAKRCRSEFDRLLDEKELAIEARPKLFAVVQGGGEKELRSHCAEALLEIGFDGYGFGGWPLDQEGVLLEDILGFTREQIPAEFPMHALGVGHPESILATYLLNYQTFDSALPTRDARQGRLMSFTEEEGLSGQWFRYLYINDEKFIRTQTPISEFCPCLCCQHYSLGYLHHLWKIKDHLYTRLASLHNLSFMHQLENRMRQLHG